MQWPEIEKQIEEPLLYNEKFPSTIDWNKENSAKASLSNFAVDYERNKVDFSRGFILPDNMGSFATTPVIGYGNVPEVIVSFPKEQEIRAALWEYYLVSTKCKKVDNVKLGVLTQFHNNVFGKKSFGFVSNMKQIPIPQHILSVLGKTFSFKGRGQSLDVDRIFVREKLREIGKQLGFLTHNLIVKLPSKLVQGKIELILANFSPGDEPKKWKVLNALKRTNLVVLTIDESGFLNQVYELLHNSGFMEKFLSGSEQYKLVLAELVERNTTSFSAKSDFSSSGNLFLKERFRVEMSNFLASIVKENKALLEGLDYKLSQDVSFFSIRPILYGSILSNAKAMNTNEEIGSMMRKTVKSTANSTNIPSLVCFSSFLLIFCSYLL